MGHEPCDEHAQHVPQSPCVQPRYRAVEHESGDKPKSDVQFRPLVHPKPCYGTPLAAGSSPRRRRVDITQPQWPWPEAKTTHPPHHVQHQGGSSSPRARRFQVTGRFSLRTLRRNTPRRPTHRWEVAVDFPRAGRRADCCCERIPAFQVGRERGNHRTLCSIRKKRPRPGRADSML